MSKFKINIIFIKAQAYFYLKAINNLNSSQSDSKNYFRSVSIEFSFLIFIIIIEQLNTASSHNERAKTIKFLKN